MGKKPYVVGVSGASGIPVALEVVRRLAAGGEAVHLVVTAGAEATIGYETTAGVTALRALATQVHDWRDTGAAIASGSFPVAGMAVVPCSMKTVAGIACGYAENLLLRAADVCLKERRRLVLAVRETPFSSIHLTNLLTLSRAGAVILPLMIGFYYQPREVEDIVRHLAGRVLEALGLEDTDYRRWSPETADAHA
ncbi:MAG: UbiX family flavin prenyltransferase [Planctomycetes bacterium]|nr:UbiX family flavin prenyltransferase [Planctomycetota bacterium]